MPSPVSAARQPAPADSLPFVFAGDGQTIEAVGARLILSQSVADGLLDAALRVVGAGGVSILVGALPFDRHAPAHLVAPEQSRRVSSQPGNQVHGAAPARLTWSVTEQPSRAAYQTAVREALARMAGAVRNGSPAVTKVVLARMLELEASAPIDPRQVFARLLADTNASAFCVPVAPRDGGTARTLVGASPELLVQKQGTTVTSLPMAGSAPRQADPAADRETARALGASAKDQREHRVVVEHVLDTLAPHCRRLHAPAAPVLASTSTMWHLATPIEGDVTRDISALELAIALHPTPAVCGSPSEAARALIAELEPFDRGYFTGAVGWCDARGDGRWNVTIRCAEIEGRAARLFAGAGIVAGSDPAAEAAETSAKFRTLLRALGVDEHGHPLQGSARS
ncbi:MAG: isochorismate synthase [Acidobacteria bacterium]|nr:isochorismate synthase [Acidobacteriota bacterium]